MIINLIRKHFYPSFTISDILIEGKFICHALEDAVRDVKIQNKTAIPEGEYKVVITHSNRFKKDLPLLLDVPNYIGVRIHPGNTSENTEGCILPGMTWDGKSDFVGSSRIAFEKLFAKIKSAKSVQIVISSQTDPISF